MPRAKATKPARKVSSVLTKATRPAKKEQLTEYRQTLTALRATLRGYKADRVEASKAARAAIKAEVAAAKVVEKQQLEINRLIAKLQKLAA